MTFVTLERFSKTAARVSFAKHALLENLLYSNNIVSTSKVAPSKDDTGIDNHGHYNSCYRLANTLGAVNRTGNWHKSNGLV